MSTRLPLTSRCSSRSGLRTWLPNRAGTSLGSYNSSRGASTEPLAKPTPRPTPSLPRERGRRRGSADVKKKKKRRRREKERERVQGRERFANRWLCCSVPFVVLEYMFNMLTDTFSIHSIISNSILYHNFCGHAHCLNSHFLSHMFCNWQTQIHIINNIHQGKYSVLTSKITVLFTIFANSLSQPPIRLNEVDHLHQIGKQPLLWKLRHSTVTDVTTRTTGFYAKRVLTSACVPV